MKSTPKFALCFALFITLTFPALVSFAQIKLNGSFVATKISYLSGDDLPDDNILKYTYVKYSFKDKGQIGISSVYYENGTSFTFAITGIRLIIKSESGLVLNTMKILENSEEKLILVSSTASGSLEDPWAIKYTLFKEEFIQKHMQLSPDDIFSVKGTDTVYKSGQKIYAQFKGPSFQSYIYDFLRKKQKDVKSGELLSTFIIDSNGLPDSLRIIQGINSKYDAEYVKAFYSAKNMWQPAQYNGKTVKVLMNQSLKYLTSEQVLPSYFDSQKANAAYNTQDYELALFYYDRALEIMPDQVEHLYRRGICKQKLGNLKGACTDWAKIQFTGSKIADELLNKYCK